MEHTNPHIGDDNGQELTTNQIKQKAQEIAKRFEKYQGRYQTSSSRCNTPLPITSADSIESIHSNSVFGDTSEKILLFRQFLENDRKLVENSIIDEQKYNNDEDNNEKKLDAEIQSENTQPNTTYYDNIISAQLQEKNIHLLKNQVNELNEKLENCNKIINEKDVLLQSKIDKIDSLNKTLMQNNKLHLETVESLKKRNNEIINEERLRWNQKVNYIEDDLAELKNNLEYVNLICDDLKKDNIEIHKENNDLRKREKHLKSDIEKLSQSFENEKMLLLKHSHESSKKVVLGLENELLNIQQENDSLVKQVELLQNSSKNIQEKDDLLHLQQENDSLVKQVALLQNNSINIQEKDNLLAQLNIKETEIQRLNIEIEELNKEFQKQTIEAEQTTNRWVQLKDAYLNDKDRMAFLEKVIEELKINNDELNNANANLIEETEISVRNLTALKTENNTYQERIADLLGVIENMREQFEKAMKEALIEYEQEKKQLIQQHADEKILVTTIHTKFEENTLMLKKATDELNIVLKENDSYKHKCSELNNCLIKNESQILDLNNIINELQQQTSQMSNELEFLKKENGTLTQKLNGTNFEREDNKLLSERFQKQKQLLKLKIKALKESENKCLLLQEQVISLTNEAQDSNLKSECLVQKNNKMNTVLKYFDEEIKNCHELLNKIVTKSNLQNQNLYTLRCVLMSMASLFSFEDNSVVYENDLQEMINSIVFPGDDEMQICLKKIIVGSIHILEYIVNLNNSLKNSEVQLVARTEVEKLIAEAVEKVKLSTQNEYHNTNAELLSLIETLKNDNQALKSNISTSVSKSKTFSIEGPITTNSLISSEKPDVKCLQNENNMLKQFVKNIQEELGLINYNETENILFQNSLSELELHIQRIQNDNIKLKEQYLEHQQKAASSDTEKQIDKYQNVNFQSSFTQITNNFVRNVDENESLTSENICTKQPHNTDESNSIINGDQKMLITRYKNLKSRFKEIRSRTVDLDKIILDLTNDLSCANAKYKQLNDRYITMNEVHEADIAHCQSEIENLMGEKLEAFRQLSELKEKHEILQNDYDQLKSNLNDKNSFVEAQLTSTNIDEQNIVLKGQLHDTQRLIDSAYSRVLCEWPSIDTNSDWVIVQSRKLDKIVDAKCNSANNSVKDFDSFELGDSDVNRLKTCVQITHEFVKSVIANECSVVLSPTNILIELMTDLKSYTETFLEFISVKNNKLHLVNEHHIELSHNTEDNFYLPKQLCSSEKSSIVEPLVTQEAKNTSLSVDIENEHFQRGIAERDRLIEFLSDKISKLDNLNRNVEDIKLVRDKLDRALTAVHERDVRCDELTLELTRLLEERDMLQLKLSNSIRQIQFLSDNKQQLSSSNLLEEKFGSKNMDDKLEELHSLEYRRDADLFTDQEQRHMSQMQLHQSGQGSSTISGAKSSNITERANTSQSWFKDILW